MPMPNLRNVTSPVIVIGPGRCGSTWLLAKLQGHPELQTVQEHDLLPQVYRQFRSSWWSQSYLNWECSSEEQLRDRRMIQTARGALCNAFPSDKGRWMMKALWSFSNWGAAETSLNQSFRTPAVST